MRIVAGAAKGRRLEAPKGDDVRPTADRVKEAMFASLQPVVPGARVLDLFAGSGALGLEALSRGAVSVTFVERDRKALEVIRRNIGTVGLPGTEVVAQPVARALAGDLPGGPFDLVLADPPYRLPKAELAALLTALLEHLATTATVMLERPARDGTPPWPAGLRQGDPRRYGDTALHRAEHDPGAGDTPDGAGGQEPS
jgi:16S rRNA (guanine966-N2)-methyltransferase